MGQKKSSLDFIARDGVWGTGDPRGSTPHPILRINYFKHQYRSFHMNKLVIIVVDSV